MENGELTFIFLTLTAPDILSLDSAVPQELVAEIGQATEASFIKAIHLPVK